MKRYIASIFLVLVLFSMELYSQVHKDIEIENKILTAVQKYNENEFEEARAILTEVLLADDGYDAAWYYQAMISVMENDAEFAQECLRNAISLDPENYWYRYRLATLYSHTDQMDLAIDLYENLMNDFPKKSQLYYEMADIYLQNGDYEKALLTAEEIENEFGMSEALTIYQYRIAYLSGNKERALQSLTKYNNQYSSPTILCLLADNEMQEYKDSTALTYYEEALDLDSSFGPALLGKAEVYRITFRYDEYFQNLYIYLKTDGADAIAKTGYLETLLDNCESNFLASFSPQLDVAMEILTDLYPKESCVYSLKGLYYTYTQRFDEAQLQFQQNARENEDDIEATVTFLRFLWVAEKWKELSAEGLAAFERFPYETLFPEMACIGYYNLGDYSNALECCKTILDNLGEDEQKYASTLSTMGDIYYHLEETKKAYKCYDAVLKINPEDPYVLNNYAYFLALEKRNLKKAHEMSRKTVEAEPDNATYLDTFGWILYLQGKPQEAKPLFKKALLHGGRESSVILDHYAEVLYSLGEYDMAFVYWNLALQKDNGDVPGLKEKVEARRQESKK